MTNERINAAVAEAERFIALANDVQLERRADRLAESTGTRRSGSLRRASMDLTRALADLRRTAP